MIGIARAAAGRLDRRAARVLPQPDRRRSRRRSNGRRSSRSSARAASFRSSTSPIRASPTASRRTARSCAASPRRRDRCSSSNSFSKSFSLYGERVGALTVVAADARRSGARALAAEAHHPRQLLQSADARRPDRGHGARVAGAARAVGSRACDDAQPDQADARDAGRAAARAHPRLRISRFMLPPARHVLVFRPHETSRSSGCAANSRSTRSTPGASASRRSIRATSTTSPTRSPRSPS